MLVFGLIGKKAVEKGVPGHGALQDDIHSFKKRTEGLKRS